MRSAWDRVPARSERPQGTAAHASRGVFWQPSQVADGILAKQVVSALRHRLATYYVRLRVAPTLRVRLLCALA